MLTQNANFSTNSDERSIALVDGRVSISIIVIIPTSG